MLKICLLFLGFSLFYYYEFLYQGLLSSSERLKIGKYFPIFNLSDDLLFIIYYTFSILFCYITMTISLGIFLNLFLPRFIFYAIMLFFITKFLIPFLIASIYALWNSYNTIMHKDSMTSEEHISLEDIIKLIFNFFFGPIIPIIILIISIIIGIILTKFLIKHNYVFPIMLLSLAIYSKIFLTNQFVKHIINITGLIISVLFILSLELSNEQNTWVLIISILLLISFIAKGFFNKFKFIKKHNKKFLNINLLSFLTLNTRNR